MHDVPPNAAQGQDWRSRPDEHQQAADDKIAVWGFLWVLFLFKIATVGLTLWAAGLSGEATMLLSITTWPWLIIPALALSGPLLFRYRLRRVRARKAALLRAEWSMEQAKVAGAGALDARRT